MTRRLWFVAALAVLAGCAQPAQKDGPQVEAPAADWSMEGCRGFDATVPLLPKGLLGGPAPQGWEPKDPTASGEVLMLLLQCKEFFHGRFERGPITFYFDLHANVDAPAPCQAGPAADLLVVNRVLVDDAEIAAVLASTLGLPIQPARFGEATAAATTTWTLEPEGGAASTFRLAGAAQPNTQDHRLRLFWETPSGLWRLDLELGHQGMMQAASWQARPPLLMSAFAQGQTASVADRIEEANAKGQLTEFLDTTCETPA